jgi:branched-chain amino acid transport system permease protein
LRIRAVVVAAVTAGALAVLAAPALAQEPTATTGPAPTTTAPVENGGTGVTVTLFYDDADDERQPVEGVAFTVTQGETEIGTGETDADGIFLLSVPSPGSYTIALDPETLPDEVVLRDPDTISRDIMVNRGQVRPALFALDAEGAAPRGGGNSGDFDRFTRLTVEGIKFGLVLAMMAVGLSLIFGTTGLTNFAHGEIVVVGTILVYYLNATGLWLPIAALIGMVIMFGAGQGLDLGLWRPLRRRGLSLISMLVISIGLSIFIRYLVLYFFGGSPRAFDDYAVQSPYLWGPLRIVPKDLWAIGISIVTLTGVGLVLTRTRVGKAIRAVADNPDLARSSGIDVDRIIVLVWGAGAALATLGGVLFAMSDQVTWDFGFKLLLLMFAGVTLGGLGTAFGAFVGSLIVGIIIQVSTLWVPTELKNVTALGLLIVILIVRPQGIFGQRERIG